MFCSEKYCGEILCFIVRNIVVKYCVYFEKYRGEILFCCEKYCGEILCFLVRNIVVSFSKTGLKSTF